MRTKLRLTLVAAALALGVAAIGEAAYANPSPGSDARVGARTSAVEKANVKRCHWVRHCGLVECTWVRRCPRPSSWWFWR